MVKAKIRDKSRLEKYKDKLDIPIVSSTFEINVICTGSRGYSKTLVIRTDRDRYMFNCGENTAKNFSQVLTSIHATNNIFFTYNSWCNVGGLLGSMMSMHRDVIRKKPVLLHGPRNVEKILGMSNSFSHLESMNENILPTFKYRGVEDGPYKDDQLTVEYVKLECQSAKHNQSDSDTMTETLKTEGENQLSASNQSDCTIAMETSQTEGENQSATHNKSDCDTVRETLPKEGQDTTKVEEKFAVAYIVTPANKLESTCIDKQKLQELNLPRGPWLKEISMGVSVTLDDGRTINPEDILREETGDKRTLLVLECPSKDYLDSLLASEQLKSLAADQERLPWLVVHMSPVSVTQDLRYVEFLNRFSPAVQHLMMNEDCKPECAPTQLNFQALLNLVHPDIFPILSSHLAYDSPAAVSVDCRMLQATSGFKYKIRPKGSYGSSWRNEFYFNKETYLEEWRQNLDSPVDDELVVLRENSKKITSKKVPVEEYPEIVFLGTGSGEPNVRRNASGILLQTRKDEYMLLACGEGTLAQLYQLYGSEVDKILVNLRAIFISHLHYNHHGGVFNVAEARCRALRAIGGDDILHIIAPRRYGSWLSLYRTYINQYELNIKFHLNQVIFDQEIGGKMSQNLDQLQKDLNLSKLVSVPVFHTKDSFGIAITHIDGWKLVYSGETRPCDKLVKYGKDCDILIHEATFDRAFYLKTFATYHSTTDEAIEVGKQMEAKYTLLTHFNQRIQNIPVFTKNFTENVGFSFDFMKLTPSQLWLVPLFKPVLQKMFPLPEENNAKTKGKRHRVER